jgi:hypothetical protein
VPAAQISNTLFRQFGFGSNNVSAPKRIFPILRGLLEEIVDLLAVDSVSPPLQQPYNDTSQDRHDKSRCNLGRYRVIPYLLNQLCYFSQYIGFHSLVREYSLTRIRRICVSPISKICSEERNRAE